MNKYDLKIYLLSFLATVLLVGALNLTVDPYALFNSSVFNGINQRKEGLRNKVRFIKPIAVYLQKPKTLLMGSSRVWKAMNPENPLLQEYPPVYNLGVDLSRIREIRILLEHAIKNSEISRVILGVDFFMFNSLQRTNYGFDEKLVGKRMDIVDLFPTIFSVDALVDSYYVMKYSNQEPLLKTFLPNGYRPQYDSDGKVDIKSYENFHYYTNWIFLTPTPDPTLYYSKMLLDDEVFREFEKVLLLCNKNHIDLKLYISPAHATLEGEGIKALGKYEDLENWKRRITIIADQYKVPLWDFGGYNSVTTETVKTPMKFYLDSSHFTELVGDMIIKRIFSTDRMPVDFGVRLTPENIDAHLYNVRVNREKYVADHRQEIKNLLLDFKSIINGAPMDVNRTKF